MRNMIGISQGAGVVAGEKSEVAGMAGNVPSNT